MLTKFSFQITAVGSIDTSGISMLEEMKKNVDRKDLKVRIFMPFFFIKKSKTICHD